MSIKKREALAAYYQFNDECADAEYTDTGKAWRILHQLAAALNEPISPAEREGNTGNPVPYRVQVYGGIEESWTRIAEVWSGLVGTHINATTAALMMIGLKSVRATYAPDYADNSDDIEGYLDIFRTLVGEDMIHVRSVSEYIEKRWPNG